MTRYSRRRTGALVWLQATATVTAFLGVTLFAESQLPAGLTESYPLRMAVAFGLTQLIVGDVLFFGLLTSKFTTELAENRMKRHTPVIRRDLTAHALGEDHEAELIHLQRRHPRVFERALFELLALVEGTPRQRLADLAERRGIVDQWLTDLHSGSIKTRLKAASALGFTPAGKTRRALLYVLDTDVPEVQRVAAHALVAFGATSDLEHVVEFAARQPLWTRAILGESLRMHAETLGRRAIPAALMTL